MCFLRTNWKEISSRYLDVLISIVFLGIPDSAFDEASSVESGIVHRVGTIPGCGGDLYIAYKGRIHFTRGHFV